MSEKRTKKETKAKRSEKGLAGEKGEVLEGLAGNGAEGDGSSADAEPESGGAGSAGVPAPEEPREDESTRYMRLAADFQNYKKRTEKEKSEIYSYANEKFAADLLEVIDNFERAVAQGAPDGKFIEGMRLIMEQLVSVLERNDVEEIAALGEEFDPNLHHAVQMEESSEFGSGRVTNVIQKGYRMKERVLRPAMVVVAR
jgi:molecular chaperone GrpE